LFVPRAVAEIRFACTVLMHSMGARMTIEISVEASSLPQYGFAIACP
jgi:hypothetical protein